MCVEPIFRVSSILECRSECGFIFGKVHVGIIWVPTQWFALAQVTDGCVSWSAKLSGVPTEIAFNVTFRKSELVRTEVTLLDQPTADIDCNGKLFCCNEKLFDFFI